MHYFSPVDKMPLLEVIPHAGTDPAVTGAAVALGKRQGKTVIVVKDVPGFYVNRCLGPYMDETAALIKAGVSPQRLDRALLDFGFPMGPATLADSVGIDVGIHVQTFLAQHLGDRMRAGDTRGLLAMKDKGLLGKKAKKGFYAYDDKGKMVGGKPGAAPVHPETQALLRDYTGGVELGPDKLADQDVALRIALRFVGEALRCLEDGIIASAEDGDIGAVFGVGFPPFRGGPFHFVDETGPQRVLDSFLRFQNTLGPHFQPPQILKDYAAANRKFRAKPE
jgi:enoyl-CoA hydratase / long-chain 3-hydroxyacyl-CoA dehydrogenase